jgi:D-inositol-3-phosphate glycosyltransferase
LAEGFGLPAIEAMAAGLPVVASRSGTLVETVVDGKTGRLVKKNDPVELADALLQLLNHSDLREAMGRAGRLRVMEQFTWDRIAKGMHSRYALLCASQPLETSQHWIAKGRFRGGLTGSPL